MKKMNAVNWFEIFVNDINRAQKFYETVLDVTMQDISPSETNRMVMFPFVENAPNAMGSLAWSPDMKAGGNSTIVYFVCDDCQVEQNRVEAAGGKVLQPKFSIGDNGFCALCIDTEGNYFGLHSMK